MSNTPPQTRHLVQQDVLDLTEELLVAADDARRSPAAFFEFVMEEEHTRRPIIVPPHQRVMLEFMEAHPRCLLKLAIDHAKTFSTAGFALWLLGKNPSMRGAIVSSTQGQASKPLGMVRDYIERNQKLRWVFPELQRSSNRHDSWSQTEITIERPYGIRDASLHAVGFGGALAGSRLNWIMVDDLLDQENTSTPEQRAKVYEWLKATVQSRLDPRGSRIIVTNTPWHPDDAIHKLERAGWPTLTMRVDGTVLVTNTSWDSDQLRPARPVQVGDTGFAEECRLSAHDPDPTNSTPLWPARYPPEKIEELRKEQLPYRFNQLYLCTCRDDASARCKIEWIEQCKVKATKEGIYGLVSEYKGPNMTFTGVDLAVSPGEEHDDTAMFTFEARPDGMRRILDVDIGQFDGPTIVDKLFDKAARYNSILRVESNAAQDFIRQFALQRNKSLPIKAHCTGRAKAHPEHGVEGLFIELYNGAWLIPTDRQGRCHPMVNKWIDACLYYTPLRHTDDILMGCYFAREQAKEWGVLSGSQTAHLPQQGSLGMSILAR